MDRTTNETTEALIDLRAVIETQKAHTGTNALEHYLLEIVEYMHNHTSSKKKISNYTFKDVEKDKNTPGISNRIKCLIDAVAHLNSGVLELNDYYKYAECYQNTGTKLNDKFFKHDTDVLQKIYAKIDSENYNLFSKKGFQEYVLFMALRLNGCYEENDEAVFNVKYNAGRESNPLTKTPKVLRSLLHFDVKEYDISRAFPSFIDKKYNVNFKDRCYTILDKRTYNTMLNAHSESKVKKEQCINELGKIYGVDLATEIVEEHYYEKGSIYREFCPMEKDCISSFVQKNEIKNYARLHDGVFVKAETTVEHLKIDDYVSFAVKEYSKPFVSPLIPAPFYEIAVKDDEMVAVTTPLKYSEFLKSEDFIRLTSNKNEIQLIKNENNIVDIFNHATELVSFFMKNINEKPGGGNFEAVANAVATENNNKIQNSLKMLDVEPLNLYKDTPDVFGMAFNNGFFHIDKNTLEEPGKMDYSTVNGMFVKHKPTQKHDFVYIEEPGDFELFFNRIFSGVQNATTEIEIKAIQEAKTMLGYCVHKYNNPVQFHCIILTDEGADGESRNGGRGKSLILQAIQAVCTYLFKGGDSFRTDYIHKFADLTEFVHSFQIDDAPAAFNYDSLYTEISGDITVQPKGAHPFEIRAKDKCKFIINTNFIFRMPESDLNSRGRRFAEYKVKPYYSREFTPLMDFEKKLFDGWDVEEWNKFYSFIFRCAKEFLNYGLLIPVYDKTSDNFTAVFSSDVNLENFTKTVETFASKNESFTVSDFLARHKDLHRYDTLVNQNNAKKLIDIFFKERSVYGYVYSKKYRNWKAVRI
jgi:hypothetical protein